MMPELSGHDAGQAEALEGPQFLPAAEHLVITADRSRIEIAGLGERILAHQLAHEGRRAREEALGKRNIDLRREAISAGSTRAAAWRSRYFSFTPHLSFHRGCSLAPNAIISS